MKFPTKDFFSKCDQIRNFLRIWSHLLKKSFFKIFSIWVFFHEHSRITGLQGKGEGISLTPHYHFDTHYRHWDISQAAEISTLHIANSRIWTGKLWFPSTSR